jgi:lipopolysaccharide transport system permease protein
MANPLTPVIENFRYAALGVGHFDVQNWLISIITTMFVLIYGVVFSAE